MWRYSFRKLETRQRSAPVEGITKEKEYLPRKSVSGSTSCNGNSTFRKSLESTLGGMLQNPSDTNRYSINVTTDTEFATFVNPSQTQNYEQENRTAGLSQLELELSCIANRLRSKTSKDSNFTNMSTATVMQLLRNVDSEEQNVDLEEQNVDLESDDVDLQRDNVERVTMDLERGDVDTVRVNDDDDDTEIIIADTLVGNVDSMNEDNDTSDESENSELEVEENTPMQQESHDVIIVEEESFSQLEEEQHENIEKTIEDFNVLINSINDKKILGEMLVILGNKLKED